MKLKLLIAMSLMAVASQAVAPAWAATASPTGTTIVAGGPDTLCIWKQIKGLPCRP